MRPRTTTGLLLTLATTLAAQTGTADAGSTSDPPIVIDSVDLGTHARRGVFASNDGTTDASAGSWSGVSRQRTRRVSVVARNAVEWDDSSINGRLSLGASTLNTPASGDADGVIEFTVPNRDRSRPDVHWDWSGISAMEALHRDFDLAPPSTCTATISCTVRCTRQSGPLDYRLEDPLGSPSSPRFAGLMLLREGIPIADCLIETDDGVDTRTIDLEMELVPGSYALVFSTGVDFGPFGSSKANLSMEFDLAFENTGPGDGEYSVVDAAETYELAGGTTHATHDWSTVEHDTYRSESAGSHGDRAAASGIVDFQAGGFTAFRHLRATQSPFTPGPESTSLNELDLVFDLPHRMDVGIGSIWHIAVEDLDRELNDGRWTLVIESIADSTIVFEQVVTLDHVDAAGFDHETDWINLDGGLHRLTLVGHGRAREGWTDTGADLGFWLAVSFRIP